MRTFFLFYLLSYLLRNPLLALIIVGAVVYFSEARMRGRYFNPVGFLSRRSSLRELRHSIDVNPHDVGAHNDLGRLLAEQGKFDEGLPHMQTAIKRMDESAETNYYLGLCLLETGDPEGGLAAVERTLEINPRFSYGQPLLTLARHFSKTRSWERTAEEAARAVTINTSSVEGWYLLGEARRQLDDREKAREAYETARETYRHLPHYLRLASKQWGKLARKALRGL